MSHPGPVPDLQEAPEARPAAAPPERPSVSIFRKRLRKFRTIKRGYYSFLLLLAAYVISFFLPVLINSDALAVRYQLLNAEFDRRATAAWTGEGVR